jgi:D-glycero-D-manno-heptose 1,7-bisphosphate phosphatase
MLFRAALEHEIDLSASWMIGDSEIDIQAGRSAGCRTVRIVIGDGVRGGDGVGGADLLAPSLLDAVRKVLALEP